MPYTRLLNLSDGAKLRLKSYLRQEVFNHYAERSQRIQQILQWQKDYWAEPASKRATFPFTGASTIIIPLTAIAVEALHARFMTTLFSMEDVLSVNSKSAQWQDAARPYEKYLNTYLAKEVKLYDFCNNFLLEDIKFGNGIGKVGYEVIKKKAIRTVGDVEQEFDVIVKDGPTLECVSVGRFLMPYTAQDPQTAPWVGEEHTMNLMEMRLAETSGLFYEGTYEKMMAYAMNNIGGPIAETRAFQDNQESLEKTNPVYPNELDFQEIWLSFPIFEDDNSLNTGDPRYAFLSSEQIELQVLFHYPTSELMAVRYNPHNDLHRPYRTSQFFPLEHRWLGIGLCKMNEQFQRTVTMINRQRLDGGTLSNMGMLKVHKLSGYGPKEPIFPGKMWFLDDMTHIEPFSLTDIQPSSYANENSAVIYSQQRSGVNEVTLGMPQVGTPGTATSDLARIQEGKAKYDYALKNVKVTFAELITDVACVAQQYGSSTVKYLEPAQDGYNFVQRVLQLPEEYIRDGLIFNFAVNSQSQNKVIDQQQAQQITLITKEYWTQMLAIAQMTGNPGLIMQVAMKAAVSGTEVFKQLLQSFDAKNVDKIILSELLNDPRIAQLIGSGAAGLNNISQQPGMVGTQAGIQAPTGTNFS